MSKHTKRKKDIMQKQHWKYMNRRYPFLISNDEWQKDKILPPALSIDSYDIPKGWTNRFGHELCEELRAEFIRCGCINNITLWEAKEKFGELRLDFFNVPSFSKYEDIIDKYSTISTSVCFKCGKMDTSMLNYGGWLIPCCKECYEQMQTLENGWSADDMLYDNIKVSKNDTTPNVYYKKSGPVDISETVSQLRKKHVTAKTDILKIRPKYRKGVK